MLSENSQRIDSQGKINFISIEDVIAFHDEQLRLFCGYEGIRDHGLLESAIMGPQSSFGGKYLYDDLYAMAAAYAHGIIKNHPFLDANKRTGISTALTFLYANNTKIHLTAAEVFALAIAIATSEVSQEDAASFFRSKIETNTQP